MKTKQYIHEQTYQLLKNELLKVNFKSHLIIDKKIQKHLINMFNKKNKTDIYLHLDIRERLIKELNYAKIRQLPALPYSSKATFIVKSSILNRLFSIGYKMPIIEKDGILYGEEAAIFYLKVCF